MPDKLVVSIENPMLKKHRTTSEAYLMFGLVIEYEHSIIGPLNIYINGCQVWRKQEGGLRLGWPKQRWVDGKGWWGPIGASENIENWILSALEQMYPDELAQVQGSWTSESLGGGGLVKIPQEWRGDGDTLHASQVRGSMEPDD